MPCILQITSCLLTANTSGRTIVQQSTTGYYRGQPKKFIVLEIVGAKESQVKWLRGRIREINRQASVLVITLNGRAKKIIANQQ
jgi:hypothetical protein